MNETTQIIRDTFKSRITAWDESHKGKVYIDLSGTGIKDIADHLHNILKCRFISITAVDIPAGIELLYHFSHDPGGTVISFRLLLADKKKPEIESIASLFRGAHWIERETHELMGVVFTGNPDQARHLILPEDWPAGSYPLRKDFISDKAGS